MMLQEKKFNIKKYKNFFFVLYSFAISQFIILPIFFALIFIYGFNTFVVCMNIIMFVYALLLVFALIKFVKSGIRKAQISPEEFIKNFDSYLLPIKKYPILNSYAPEKFFNEMLTIVYNEIKEGEESKQSKQEKAL